MSDLIEQAREMIAASSSVVALTGAGVSTPSGIPDFRSADSGLREPTAVTTLRCAVVRSRANCGSVKMSYARF